MPLVMEMEIFNLFSFLFELCALDARLTNDRH
jgi:hypothetical protein